VPSSVLEAIKLGHWDFEPSEVESDNYDSTLAMPGTDDKLKMLAERVREGLPLWHPGDRLDCDDQPEW
jgi:hypothetical protein